jgi:DNA polymerase gamma 1
VLVTHLAVVVQRNEVGVQLLSRKLHAQIFKNVRFPSPSQQAVRIAQEHLAMHGLDPSQGSVLPNTEFDLPELQGNTLDEHFYSIGTRASRPWLGLAKDLASSKLPSRPDRWDIRSGWTKYYHQPNGTSHTEPVRFPEHDGVPEDMLVFDVETMPAYSPYPVMACAATKNGWYAWISPWLLGETDDPQQLVPFGDRQVHRVIVGHNVSFDRGRILEEYNLEASQTRFLDTMALHVAVQGISSHQRPAWMAYRKSKLKEQKQREEEALEAVTEVVEGSEEIPAEELDSIRKEDLKRIRREVAESLPSLEDDGPDSADVETVAKRWEELTSANSLADVAKLHCNIVLSKETRNDFMTETPESIREKIDNYLNYCSSDVKVTHAVYAQVLPSFLKACPNPVSFAGMLAMGSSFLTVNQEWEKYLENAENKYRDLELKVKSRLIELAEAAKILMDNEKWKNDPWLSQLDWTPKKAGKSRGVEPSMVGYSICIKSLSH